MILYLNSDSLPKKNNNSALLEVTILILPLPNQIILHMINKIFIKIPLFFCQKHWIKIFNLSSNEKIKIFNKTIKILKGNTVLISTQTKQRY